MSEASDLASVPDESYVHQFETLEVPPGIDPLLLELWYHREREALKKGKPPEKKPYEGRTRKLTWLFASYIGILVMCLVIVLGMIQGRETQEILKQTCQAFLVYAVIGFFAGWIAEYCVAESVSTLLREAVRKMEAATAAHVAHGEEAATTES